MATKGAVSDLIRGNIDAIILCTLSSKRQLRVRDSQGCCHGESGEYEMKEPSPYTSLKRLEKQGFVESYWGDETQGARRKYYHMTPAGVDGACRGDRTLGAGARHH